ncbi:MAG: polysaccharide deacetylase family protein [Acidobacteriaceae bacterium]
MTDLQQFRDEAAALEPLLATRPLIRAANFHNTPRFRAAEYDRQLQQWSRHFSSINEHDLDQYLTVGHWHKKKPGLIVAMYNGYRDNYDVIFPLLERYGFIGWFFVATGFVSTAVSEQPAFTTRHTLRTVANEYTDGRYALSWSELKELDRNHVIASHTRNHSKLATENPATLEGEIVGPQQDFEAHLGHRVRSFASLSGAPYGDQAEANRLIDTAGYQFIFSNFRIQRL